MSAAEVKKEEPKTPVASVKPSGPSAGPSPSGSRGGGRGGPGGPMRGGRGGFQRGGHQGGHPYQRGGGRGGGPQRGRAKKNLFSQFKIAAKIREIKTDFFQFLKKDLISSGA